MESSGPQASGSAFLGTIKHIKQTYGEERLQRIVERGGTVVAEVFAQRIYALAWYPYESFTCWLVAIDEELGSGDLSYCRQLGAQAGERDLGTVFKLLRRLASPERLIRSADRVWEKYYRNAGRMEAVSWSPDNTVLGVFDFPAMHPAHCRLMEGWMIQTMQVIGVAVSDDAREAKCPSRGDPHHEFCCTWTRM